MQNNDLRDLTDVNQPLDHVKFSEHSEEEKRLAEMILLRQVVRESHRIRKRVTYSLLILLILVIALLLILFNESLL
ncbi:MAG TPA: hypothetical protein VKX30_04040 [Flavobacteriaceae bacterium]|nr:hypothetical protein [Flavobacteriaceae bacterium]